MRATITRLILSLCLTISAASAALAGEVAVSAAASLKDALNEIVAIFAKKSPGTKIIRNYGASGALAKQIENGAPADLFISANLEWMDYLKARKLVEPSSIGTLARNALVFVGPSGTRAAGMQDVAGLNRIAIGSPRSVPAGEYAMEAIKKAGIAKGVTGKLITAKDVREALMYAERGEVDGAFVYRTDALLARRAKILFTVPEALHASIVYPMALTAAGAKKAEAGELFRFLRSAEAKKVLEKYGFAIR